MKKIISLITFLIIALGVATPVKSQDISISNKAVTLTMSCHEVNENHNLAIDINMSSPYYEKYEPVTIKMYYYKSITGSKWIEFMTYNGSPSQFNISKELLDLYINSEMDYKVEFNDKFTLSNKESVKIKNFFKDVIPNRNKYIAAFIEKQMNKYNSLGDEIDSLNIEMTRAIDSMTIAKKRKTDSITIMIDSLFTAKRMSYNALDIETNKIIDSIDVAEQISIDSLSRIFPTTSKIYNNVISNVKCELSRDKTVTNDFTYNFTFCAKNESSKTIKYVYIDIIGFKNAVNDYIKDYRGNGDTHRKYKETGPIEPGGYIGTVWFNSIYNIDARTPVINWVKIEYMDGSTYMITGKELNKLIDYEEKVITIKINSLDEKISYLENADNKRDVISISYTEPIKILYDEIEILEKTIDYNIASYKNEMNKKVRDKEIEREHINYVLSTFNTKW